MDAFVIAQTPLLEQMHVTHVLWVAFWVHFSLTFVTKLNSSVKNQKDVLNPGTSAKRSSKIEKRTCIKVLEVNNKTYELVVPSVVWFCVHVSHRMYVKIS